MARNSVVGAPPRPAVLPSRRRRRAPGAGWGRLPMPALLIAGLGLLALLLTPAVIVGGIYAYCQLFGRIYPNVRVGGVDLSWMTRYRAEAVLGEQLGMGGEARVTDGARTWHVPLADLGLSLDPVNAAWAAYNVGRGQPLMEEIDLLIGGLRYGWQLDPAVSFDPALAQAGLKTLDAQVALPPENANLVLQGDQLVAVPGKLGYAINIEETLKTLDANPAAPLSPSGLRLTLKPVPPAVQDASPARQQAERLLSSDFRVDLYDPISDERGELPVPRSSLAAWLRIEASEGGPVVSLDEAQVAAYLNEQVHALGEGLTLNGEKNAATVAQAVREGRRPTVILGHLPTTYTVKSGDTLLKIGWKLGFPLWKLVEANPGLNPDKVLVGSVLQVPSKDELLPLPIIPNKRIVMSIAKQRMWIYQDGKEIRKFVISTGIDRSPTQPGVFQVQSHRKNAYASVWDLTMPHFLGIYEAWPGFMNGIHGLPMLSNGTRLWANILGRPASYGCIILDLDDAQWLYNWAEDGVVVEIQP